MNQVNKPDKDKIKETYKKFYNHLAIAQLKNQSSFLYDIYNQYNRDLEAANIVLYYKKKLHNEILREKDNDLDFEISLKKFWINCKNSKDIPIKIIEISKETVLPKETARRKVQLLISKKIFKKNNNKISWELSDDDKVFQNKLMEKEIAQLAKLIKIFCDYLKINLNLSNINESIKNNFSFFWYHYLKYQLIYLKTWQIKLHDLELLLILTECSLQSFQRQNKYNYDFQTHFNINKENVVETNLLSSTFLSEMTGLPRATCIRKLNTLTRMKFIKKDLNSKKYYLNHGFFSNEFEKQEEKLLEIFSEFFLIVLKALTRENFLKG